MTIEGLVICALATWRLSFLLTEESGPWDLILKLRERFGITHQDGKPISWPDGMLGSLFGCLWCISVWLAPIMVVAWLWCPVVVFVVAVAGAAAALDQVVRGR